MGHGQLPKGENKYPAGMMGTGPRIGSGMTECDRAMTPVVPRRADTHIIGMAQPNLKLVNPGFLILD